MKRTLLLLIWLFFAFCLIHELLAQQKKLTVSGPVEQWQNALEVMEQSNAPHLQVKQAQAFIISQLNEQMKVDSAKVKKP